MQNNPFKNFIGICLSALVIEWAINYVLISDEIFFDTFSEQLSFEKITQIIDLSKKWRWAIYPLLPIVFFTKFFLISLCLACGAFLLRFEIEIKSLFKIVIISEFIFLLPPTIKLFWFGLIDLKYSLEDIQFFSPLSAINLFDRTSLEPWLVYPLSLINLFEVAYIFALAYFTNEASESNFGQSLKLVWVSYGTGLLIWVIFVTFLTVSLNTV